jgi:hypothetical protein
MPAPIVPSPTTPAFRISRGTVGDANAVAETEAVRFLRELSAEQFDVAVWTREAVLAADPDLIERVYRGWRGIGFRHPDAGYICAIYPRSDWVVLHFEHGASMPDPDGILIGEGSQTRFLRIAERDPTLRDRIVAYVQQAIGERLLDRGN